MPHYDSLIRQRQHSGAQNGSHAQTQAENLLDGAPLAQRMNPKTPVRMQPQVQGRMERAFSADLSGLSLFESPAVSQSGFEALSQGASIGFAPGRFSPATQSGLQLLGHELSHVVSQARGDMPQRAQDGAPVEHPAFESKADSEGARAARGESLGNGSAVSPAAAFSSAAAAAAAPVQGKPGWWGDQAVGLKRWWKEHGLAGQAAKQEALRKKAQRTEELNRVFDPLGVRGVLAVRPSSAPSGPAAPTPAPATDPSLPPQPTTPPPRPAVPPTPPPAAPPLTRAQKAKKGFGKAVDVADKLLDPGSLLADIAGGGAQLGGAGTPGLGAVNALGSVVKAGKSIRDYAQGGDDRRFMTKGRKAEEAIGMGHSVLTAGKDIATAVPVVGDVVGSPLSLADDAATIAESGLKLANNANDYRHLKATQQSTTDLGQRNMLEMGKSRVKHDSRDAAADMAGSVLSAAATGTGMAFGPAGMAAGAIAGSGAKLLVKGINAGVQHHYDAKEERRHIGGELEHQRALSGSQTQTSSYEALKERSYDAVHALRVSQRAAGGQATRYTKKEIKEAISRNVAGVSGGRKGMNKAVMATYVQQLSDPARLEENRAVLEALGFRLDKAKQAIEKENRKRAAKGKPPLPESAHLPSKGAIAKALGWRGDDDELETLMAGTSQNVPAAPASPAPAAAIPPMPTTPPPRPAAPALPPQPTTPPPRPAAPDAATPPMPATPPPRPATPTVRDED